jgi:DASS family divalent anion:Na+ symporter
MKPALAADPVQTPAHDRPALSPLLSLALIALLALVILFIIPRPAGVSVQGWRMLAIFACTVLALMLRPIPGGASVLIGVTLMVLAGVLTMSQALTAYGSSTVWLVVAAFFIARALIGSGLARRIALLFIRTMGHTSLGLGYSLAGSDLVLAGIVPSNSARVGGVIFPITRSLAVIYESLPGPTASLLGTYLMLTIYQGDLIACAMFLTGQASNPIGARLAMQTAQVEMTWAGWLWASWLPGLATMLALPWVIYRLSPPAIKHTPQAAEMARRELAEMGPLSRDEKIVLAVFILVCGLWATSSLHRIETTAVALLGAGVLLATRTLSWGDAIREHVAWDVFIWYGGLVRMGEALNDSGVTAVFARWVSGHFSGWRWPVLMAALVLIYFYIHYAFASMTTHMIALYVPFLAILLTSGAPAALAAYALMFYTNLSASLTHYGTTHSPIIFAAGYVSVGRWWRVGLLISFVNLAIWTVVGFVWWKIIGLW